MSENEINFKSANIIAKNIVNSDQGLNDEIHKWEQTKSLISKDIKDIFWKAWIKPLKFQKYENGILYLTTESKIICTRAETQYYDTIFFQASIFFKSLKKIQFHSVSSKQKENISLKKDVQKIKINQHTTYSDLSFIDSVSMKTNSKFTFDNFVVGESNRMPYAASKRICEKNSLAYNPLFIHGDVGMGKTHLLNAIAINLIENFPNLKIVMMSAERFMYQFIKSLRLKETIKFKDQLFYDKYYFIWYRYLFRYCLCLWLFK